MKNKVLRYSLINLLVLGSCWISVSFITLDWGFLFEKENSPLRLGMVLFAGFVNISAFLYQLIVEDNRQ